MVIVPERDGPNFGCSQIMLDIAQDPFLANAYRIALIVSLEDLLGRVQILWRRGGRSCYHFGFESTSTLERSDGSPHTEQPPDRRTSS